MADRTALRLSVEREPDPIAHLQLISPGELGVVR
jgi:hypothetical protein